MRKPAKTPTITGYMVTYGSGPGYTEQRFTADQNEEATKAYVSASRRPHHANTARIRPLYDGATR